MYAGKSSELLRRVKRYEFAKRRCLVVKYDKDTRYSKECVATHDRVMREAVTCDTLMPFAPRLEEFDVVGVDEGQFFPDLVQFAELAANAGARLAPSPRSVHRPFCPCLTPSPPLLLRQGRR